MRDSSPPRTEAVMQAVRAKLRNRALGAGDRLPSVRRAAHELGVSPSTVVEAYARLEAEGVILGRRGSGFYVTGDPAPSRQPEDPAPAREREVDPFWVSRQSLDAGPEVLKPGCGWLPADWLPQAALRRGLRDLSRAGDALLADYGSAGGGAALRRLLLARLTDEGITATDDQLMLTGSGTQAIDLICRLLLQPGDTVLVDDPCYFNFRALLQAHRVRIVGVPFTPEGPDLAAFEQSVRDEQPRLYLTNSALHNPTGATLTPRVTHRVLSAAVARGVTIVEDDIFADFEPTLSPRYALLDGLEHVIRIGSFSKTLSAALRCGYIAARPDLIERLLDLQVAINFGGPSPIATTVIAGVLTGGSYRKHIAALQQRLSAARAAAITALAPLGLTPWVVPRGGFFLWCQLPVGHDSAAIARHCLRHNVLLAPGNVFSVSQSAGAFFRFNVTQMGGAPVLAMIRRAMENPDAGLA